MNTRNRWRVGVGAMLVAFLAVGCNPLTMPFFMLFGIDDKAPPEYKLASATNKEVRAVILTYSASDTSADLIGVDKTLATQVSKHLQEGFTYNKEKVYLIPQHKVEKFKSDHPGWRSMGPAEIGKYFNVDYLIDLEVVSMTLHEPGSMRQLFKGTTEVSVSVRDLHRLNEGPVYTKQVTALFPRSRGPIPANETSPDQFRATFVDRVATDIAWLFTAHLSSDTYHMDRTD